MDNFMIYLIGFSLISLTISYGFDAGTDQGACGKPVRASRAMNKPPCDLIKESYCTSAGNQYPWHAVRRFIRENQGLMRRMYGDERHLAVLKAELHNEVEKDYDFDDDYEPPTSFYRQATENEDLYQNGDFKTRYSKQDHLIFDDNELFDEARYIHQQDRKEEIILNTKFVYSQEPGMQIKLKEVLQAPKFTQKQQKDDAKQAETLSQPQEAAEVVDVENGTNSLGRNYTYGQVTGEVGQGYQGKHSGSNESTNQDAVNVNNDNLQTNENIEFATQTSSTSQGISTEGLPPVKESTTFKQEEDHRTSSYKPEVYETSATSEDYEEETTTQETYDQTENPDNKRPVGEMLFQDFQESNSKPPHKDYNYNNKLRGVNACPVKEEVVAPFWANNTRGEVLALLNLYPFEQYVHWEKCTYEHRQMYCREGCRCEQQYRLHRLLAYDPNNECRGIFSDWFRFPSCCVCKCYDMPAEFRVTSRSPRSRKDPERREDKREREKPSTWFAKKKLNLKRFN